MNTRRIGIHPDDGDLQPHGGPSLAPPPLHTHGQGEGGSPGRRIQLHRRLLEYTGFLDTVLGYESWTEGLTGGNAVDPNW